MPRSPGSINFPQTNTPSPSTILYILTLPRFFHWNYKNNHHGQIQQTLRHRSRRIAPSTHRVPPRELGRGQVAHRRIRCCTPVWGHSDVLEACEWTGAVVPEREGSFGWFEAHSWWDSSGVSCMFFPRIHIASTTLASTIERLGD